MFRNAHRVAFIHVKLFHMFHFSS